jgi:hypothetical protein
MNSEYNRKSRCKRLIIWYSLQTSTSRGMAMAKQIKKMVGEKIKVQFDFIDTKSVEKKFSDIKTKVIK